MDRGKALTPEDIAVVSALYESVRAEMPPGAVCGILIVNCPGKLK